MINMAVVNLKDILKYFLKITIVIVVIVGITKYITDGRNQIDKINIGSNATFLSCFDITIPGIASLNHEAVSTNNSNKQDPLQLALGVELEMLTSVKQKENVDELASNNTSEEENMQTNSQNEGQNTENSATVQKAETGLKTEVQESNVPEKYSTQYNGVKIRNETDYKLTDEILTPDIEINKENILIFHTHTCESYTASEKYQYKQTGNFRTTDRNYSVVRVGREVKDQ